MFIWSQFLPYLPDSTVTLLTTRWFGNTVGEYLQALVFALLLSLGFSLVRRAILWRIGEAAKYTENRIDDLVTHMAQQARWPLFVVLSFALAGQTLNLPDWLEWWLSLISWASATSVVILMLQLIIDFLVERPTEEQEGHTASALMRSMGTLVKVGLWVFGLLLILSNVGINVYSLIAGLGVSGIIVAFALQNVLQDLFDSLAIHVDRPFELGDFIEVKDYMGTVERIGLKSTHVRSLSGEQLIIPNSELTGAKIQNYRRMDRRRVQFSFLVGLDTPNSKLKKIPTAVAEIFDTIDDATFSRAHLADLESNGWLFVVVYHVEDSDFVLYRDIHQQVLLDLKSYLEKQKVTIPYPTQTVLVQR